MLETRLSGISHSALIQEFGANNIRILTETPKFSGEELILQSLLRIIQQPSEEISRIELLKRVLLDHLSECLKLESYRSNLDRLLEQVQQRIRRPIPGDTLPKVIIFTSFIQTGAEIVRYLSGTFGSGTVASHQLGMKRSDVEKNLDGFKNDPNCFILVCDSSGEEGRNFQFVNGMIHFDLPWSPNRLEQRIGRIDRIGRPLNVQITVFAGSDLEDSPHAAWYQLLKDGFGIFHQSIASLQFYVDEKLPELETVLFQSGASGLLEKLDSIREGIAGEQVKISEQIVNHATAYYGDEFGQEQERRQEIRDRIRDGTQRIVFTSPESLMNSLAPALYEAAQSEMLRYFVIDEAHIVEQWGDEFRPAFQELPGLRRDLLRWTSFTTLLLTATLTESCLDTPWKFYLGNPALFK